VSTKFIINKSIYILFNEKLPNNIDLIGHAHICDNIRYPVQIEYDTCVTELLNQ
jgi:hypothetical protein